MRSRHLVAFVATAAVISLVPGSFAGAGAPICASDAAHAPDGTIKSPGGLGTGAGVFGDSLVFVTVPSGTDRVVTARWRNTTAKPRTILVSLFDLFRTDGMRVRIRVNDEDVTSIMRNGGAPRFQGVAPGKATPKFEIVFKNRGAGEQLGDIALIGTFGQRERPECDALAAEAADTFPV